MTHPDRSPFAAPAATWRGRRDRRREWLLDHQEVIVVETLEERCVRLDPVGRVCVNREGDGGKPSADGCHELRILIPFDLKLDPLVAALKLAADYVEQRFGRILDADRNPAGDFLPHAAEVLP